MMKSKHKEMTTSDFLNSSNCSNVQGSCWLSTSLLFEYAMQLNDEKKKKPLFICITSLFQ